MRKVIVALVLMLGAVYRQTAKEGSATPVVLPTPPDLQIRDQSYGA
jgi:hypothetical protein